jgi:hypothetical protein
LNTPLHDGDGLNDARRDIEHLKETMEKQAVLMRALFTLVSERIGLTETDLLERFRELELEKSAAPATRCWQCGRTINLRHQKCYYCGEAHRVSSAFELLDAGVWPESPKDSRVKSSQFQKDGIVAIETDQMGITILPGD